jgi:hypothetical protein
MSVSSVIGDVTSTLKKLLEDQQSDSIIKKFKVSLASPADEIIDPNETKINLYLFRIDENPFGKNREWLPIGTETRHYPPLALNLFYVLTPYSELQTDGHRALGEAMRILHDHAILQSPHLQNSLEFSQSDLKIELCPFNLEELTRVWNAFNIAYRLSVCYQVRIIFIDSLLQQDVRRVTEKENQHL